MTKNRKKWLVSISIAFGIIFIIIFIGLFIGLENDKKVSAILALGILIILLLAVLLSYYAIIEFARSRDLIKKSFNGFIEEIMTNNNIGVCIYDTKQEIV